MRCEGRQLESAIFSGTDRVGRVCVPERVRVRVTTVQGFVWSVEGLHIYIYIFGLYLVLFAHHTRVERGCILLLSLFLIVGRVH